MSDEPRVRVAVAEIQTGVYRAFVAQGASPGEARVAADAAALAEIATGDGVALAAADLQRVPREAVGVAVEGDAPPRLADPRRRALLLQLPIALAWLGARADRTTLAVPHERCPLAVGGILRRAGVPGVAVAAVGMVGGVATGGVAVDADAGLLELAGDGGLVAADAVAALGDGILLVRAPARLEGFTRVAPDELERRRRAAGVDGLQVDAEAWRAVDALAKRHLVPEG
jgi:hypothetical protein